MSYYITPEEYEIAAKNGIDKYNLERRIRSYGWNKKRALTEPLRKPKDRKYWAEIALKNGIPYSTFIGRVNTLNYTEEEAAHANYRNRIHRTRICQESEGKGERRMDTHRI